MVALVLFQQPIIGFENYLYEFDKWERLKELTAVYCCTVFSGVGPIKKNKSITPPIVT